MVKCADCGLLALRHYETRKLCEAEPEWRRTGVFVCDDAKRLYSGPVLCLAKIQILPSVNDERACFAEVAKDRECGSFLPWQQGFTPKEHMEMRLSREMIESEQRWREAQAERERRWREEDVERAKADMAVKILIPICTTIFGIIGGALATWFVKDAIQRPHSPMPPTSASAASNPPNSTTP